MPNLRMMGAALVVLVTTTVSTPAFPQDWPTRPVTLVVTFAAGSGDDVLARILSPRLSELLGQQVIVENIGGAGGMNGANRVAKAAPDGYQLVLGGTGTFAANQTLYKNPLYSATADFMPVALVAEQPILLAVRKGLPAGNLHEFIAYTKAHQAKLQYASGGPGSATHLACVLLNSAIGVNVTHVPYRSTAVALHDVIGDRIDYACPILSTVISQIEGKQVKAPAILSKNRSRILPNLASAHEQGLANFDAYIWNGIFLPKGTPVAIVQKLHAAIVGTMDTPAVQARINEIGGSVVAPERRSAQYLQQFVASEIEKWAGPVRASGISMD
jgi:tripartite-type tricarboxylate transporter receptor subunit TctC